MKSRYLFLIAICSYLFFTLTNVPAAKVFTLIKSNIEIPAHISGIEGSLWKGSAESVSVINQPEIKNLQWDLSPLSLLIAQLSSDIKLQIEQQDVSAHVDYNLLSNNVFVSEGRLQMTAEKFQQLANIPFVQLAGKIDIEVNQLSFEDQKITQLDAIARWKKAKFTLAETVSLGNIQIIAATKEEKLVATISNKGGLIKLDGEVSLATDKNYQADMIFEPAKNAKANIKQSLAMFAKRQTNGAYRFKQKGNLSQLGL